MRKALLAALLLFLPLSLAEARQPVGVGLSTGYQSFMFSPALDELDVVRVDNSAIAPFYTGQVGGAHYFRVGGELNGTDTGFFFLNWGWDLSPTAAAFIGPSVRIIDGGAIEGFTGDTFALGLNGSVDLHIKVADTRESEVVSAFFGVEHTTRRLTHVASGRTTHGLTISLGIDLSSVLFGAKEPADDDF